MALEDWIGLDQRLLLLLNGSNSLFFDHLMNGITSTVAWIPVAVVLFYVLVKNNSMREVGLIVLFLALSILLADQFSSSFCKPYFARFRPAQDPLADVFGRRGGWLSWRTLWFYIQSCRQHFCCMYLFSFVGS